MTPKDSAPPCNGSQSRDHRYSGWYHPPTTKADAPKAPPDSEQKSVTERKRAAMAFGLDPSRPSTADTMKATVKDDGEQERRRRIEATFGIKLPAADHPQDLIVAQAFGLRKNK